MDFIKRANENEIGRKVKIADLKETILTGIVMRSPWKKDVQRMQKYHKAFYELRK